MSEDDHPARSMVEILRSLSKREGLEDDGFVCLSQDDLDAMDRQLIKLVQEMGVIEKHYGLMKTALDAHIAKTREEVDKISDSFQISDRHAARIETLLHSINADVGTLERKLCDLAKRVDEGLH